MSYKTGFKPYWANTSSNDILKERIEQKSNQETREDIEKLLNGETIEKELYENFIFSQLDSNLDLIWTLLAFSGYLTVENSVSEGVYGLRIPNYEIRLIFKQMILSWINNEIKIVRTLLQDTANYLITNQIEKFAKGFQKIIGDTFSYFDMVGAVSSQSG